MKPSKHNFNKILKEFYAAGKNKDCEICRIRGRKKKAYGEREIEGISYFLCWDCCLDTERDQRKKEKQNDTNCKR
jgi:hypothetical protein